MIPKCYHSSSYHSCFLSSPVSSEEAEIMPLSVHFIWSAFHTLQWSFDKMLGQTRVTIFAFQACTINIWPHICTRILININVNFTHYLLIHAKMKYLRKLDGEKLFSKKRKPHQMYKSHATFLQPSHLIVGKRGKWKVLSRFDFYIII